jgi:hypothetical protein
MANIPLVSKPRFVDPPQRVREQEILRISANLYNGDTLATVLNARSQVLTWAQNKVIGTLPEEAWRCGSFEHLSSGRNCTAVRIEDELADIWSLRIEDPDKTVARRAWATEITISFDPVEEQSKFTLRLLVGTPEIILDIQPSVPGVVRQIILNPGLINGGYKLKDTPLLIPSMTGMNLLIKALLDPLRKLPIILLSVPSDAEDVHAPLLDAKMLAQSCAGLAIVAILPSELCWKLTERFGKRLSVYEGAARVYLPGFTEDANPFGGHELILANRFQTPEGVAESLTRLRWIAANGSVRRLQLGSDVLSFASLKAHGLERKQAELRNAGATDREQLDAARKQIKFLKEQVSESEKYQKEFSNLHEIAEERAESSETQLRAATFRIQQLLDQIKAVGASPDERIELPQEWEEFANWCDLNLAGRVILTPQARRGLRSPIFSDIEMAARCLLWLANEYRTVKMQDLSGTLRDVTVVAGVINAHCGSDVYKMEWQSSTREVEWHIKNGGNTRDPVRCLRIYYFWDESTQEVVIASMPAHRRTDAT